MKLLIDADMSCYAVANSCKEEPLEVACRTLAGMITDIIADLTTAEDTTWTLFLSGASADNFRHDVAVTAPYKGNRPSEKPAHLQGLRDYLLEEWDAQLSVNQEADDDIATAAEGDSEAIIVSQDKDFDQCVGWRYNPRHKKLYEVTEESGKLWFYRQFLIGDSIDNIKGADGIGAVKSLKLLEGLSEEEMWDCVVEQLGYDRALENGKLLHLRRYEDEDWTPPTEEN